MEPVIVNIPTIAKESTSILRLPVPEDFYQGRKMEYHKTERASKMTIWDFADLHEKKCSVTTMDGTVFRGDLYLGETEFDSSSGEDEIDVFTGKGYVCLPVSDIKSAVLI